MCFQERAPMTNPDTEESAEPERHLSVEEHLRKALAYADAIRAITNLACEDENLPKFDSPHEVFDWVFEVAQVLEDHLLAIKETLTADCLNMEATLSEDDAISGEV
jgi:hypothetical protein